MTDLLVMPKKTLPYHHEKLIAETKCHGGKNYLTRRIWALAPKKVDWFIDVYGGSGSMTYNAPHCGYQSFNDKNYFRVLTKRAIKFHPAEMVRSLQSIAYNETAFLNHKRLNEEDIAGLERYMPLREEIDVAVSYIVRNRMSRGGLGESFAWSDRLRGGQPGDLNAWMTMIERIPTLSRRLQNVDIRQQDALFLIEGMGKAVTPKGTTIFLYLDPPYPHLTRTTSCQEYGEDEMTLAQHEEMLDTVLAIPHVHFAISSYNNELYERKLKDWSRVEFSMPNHSGQTKSKERRFEILWTNYQCERNETHQTNDQGNT